MTKTSKKNHTSKPRSIDLTRAKTYQGKTLGGLYVLRNGAHVRHVISGAEWCAPILMCQDTIDKRDGEVCKKGSENCLLWAGENPLHWKGGAWGTDFDVVKAIRPKKKRQPKKAAK